jgi:hypothetical protein
VERMGWHESIHGCLRQDVRYVYSAAGRTNVGHAPRSMRWIARAVALSVVLWALVGCGSYQPVLVDTRKPTLDGSITTVRPASPFMALLVENTIQGSPYVTMTVGIANDTHVYLKDSATYRLIAPDQYGAMLRPGTHVWVWLDDPVLDSWPPQGKAREIIIVPEGP